MTDLFWPGDNRAGEIFSQHAFMNAMLEVENAWLSALVDAGVAPGVAREDLTKAATVDDLESLAVCAERDGTPVTGLVRLLRQRAGQVTRQWLHRGLTSQDVVDTALMMCLRDAIAEIGRHISVHVSALVGLADSNRCAPMLARTLTQPALPSTVAMKLAHWLWGVLDAADTLRGLPPLGVQAGGAAGTLAAATELTGSPERAIALSDALATALRLTPAVPWHTTRSVVTRAGDAFVTCCDAWGHIASDVTTGARAEIGELAELRGGTSSTMPHKHNPVLSVLIRRAALCAPPLGSTLHAAAATSVDERSDGGWHAEWATLRTLSRHTVVAAAQTTDLLAELVIDRGRAAANLAEAAGVLAEQQAMAELTRRSAYFGYAGAGDQLVDAALRRARAYLEDAG